MYHQRQETSSRNKFREHEGAGTLNDNCCHQPQKEKMKWINFLGLEINTKTGKRRKKGVIANQTRKKYCGDIFVFRFLRCWRNFFTEQASQHLRFWAGETVRQKNDMNTLNIMVAVEHDMQEMQLKCDRWVWWPTTKMLWRARRWVCDPGCSRKKGENQVRKNVAIVSFNKNTCIKIKDVLFENSLGISDLHKAQWLGTTDIHKKFWEQSWFVLIWSAIITKKKFIWSCNSWIPQKSWLVVDWLDLMVEKVWLLAKYNKKTEAEDVKEKAEALNNLLAGWITCWQKKMQRKKTEALKLPVLWKITCALKNNLCFEKNSEMTSRKDLKTVWRMTSRNKKTDHFQVRRSRRIVLAINEKIPVSEKVQCSTVTSTQCTTGMLGLMLWVC